jgi:hypothetical protein
MNRAKGKKDGPSFQPFRTTGPREITHEQVSGAQRHSMMLLGTRTSYRTPSLLHRVKRTTTEFQLPYRWGRSRQGAPVRRNPENAIGHSPLVFYRRAALAPVGQKWIENLPFRVRQIAATQCCLPKKGNLESLTYEKTVNTA